jgi:hypothetical protein
MPAMLAKPPDRGDEKVCFRTNHGYVSPFRGTLGQIELAFDFILRIIPRHHFNQFTSWERDSHVTSLGFARVVDPVDLYNPGGQARHSPAQGLGLAAVNALPSLKLAGRTFAPRTSLVCVK